MMVLATDWSVSTLQQIVDFQNCVLDTFGGKSILMLTCGNGDRYRSIGGHSVHVNEIPTILEGGICLDVQGVDVADFKATSVHFVSGGGWLVWAPLYRVIWRLQPPIDDDSDGRLPAGMGQGDLQTQTERCGNFV